MSGKETREKISAAPSMGGNVPAGKGKGGCEETLRKGSLPPKESVREAKEGGVSVKACREKQIEGDGSPKARTRNYWGRSNDKEV